MREKGTAGGTGGIKVMLDDGVRREAEPVTRADQLRGEECVFPETEFARSELGIETRNAVEHVARDRHVGADGGLWFRAVERVSRGEPREVVRLHPGAEQM